MKTVSFQNPICKGADPWMFPFEGKFYLCTTARSRITLWRAADPTRIHDEKSIVAFEPEDGHEWSLDLWSPEIHYFSPEDFGEKHAGWYLFIACDDGRNVNHRMYVLKSEDPHSPFAHYGNPVTGERNVPEKFVSPVDKSFNTAWCCGQTILRACGNVYAMWVDEVGRQTEDFHQRVCLAKLQNPYTAETARVIIRPTEDWEMHGFGMCADGKIRPRVVEGGTAIYGDDGTVYLTYSGSGYWTPYYALGQLTLQGDPENIADWKKEKAPIFSMSDKVFGCGHASFFKDAAGDRFICYHAYLSREKDAKRYVFLERYRIEDGKIIIGNGSGKPADYQTTTETITIF